MSDPASPRGADPAPPRPNGSSGVKWLLALSLAANLAVAGFVIGDALDGGLHGPGGMPRDMHFGPFSDALEQDDRRALARALFERSPDMREMRRHMRGDLDQIIAALSQEPFDPAALDLALSGQARRVTEALALSQEVLRGLLVSMSPEERRAFAQRLRDRWGPERSD